MCAGNHPGDAWREWERRLAEEDEAMQADLARERRIEKTPVEIPQEIPTVGYEGYARRPDPLHEQRTKALEAVLRRKLPGLEWLTDDWIRGLAEELLAAAETAI